MEDPKRFGFSVANKGKMKGFLWSWQERIDPKKPRVSNDKVLAVMVPSLSARDAILASDSEKFFTEPHYNGFPAVLVRLEKIKRKELEDLIIEAWKCKAPKDLVKQYDDRKR